MNEKEYTVCLVDNEFGFPIFVLFLFLKRRKLFKLFAARIQERLEKRLLLVWVSDCRWLVHFSTCSMASSSSVRSASMEPMSWRTSPAERLGLELLEGGGLEERNRCY